MNPEFRASSPAAPAVTTTTEPAAAPLREAAAEACRAVLNAEASTGRIYFANGSFNIAPVSQTALKKIAKVAKDCGAVVIEIDGHTDNTGSPAANKKLSERRAKAVVKFLRAAGVDAGKLKAAGFGQDRPIASNDKAEGQRLNRRIELFVSSG
jgi:outer membrane protein OmpA-like peptidoglycan-associated protein